MKLETKNIIIDLVLTLVTAGLWNLWIQYRQMRQTNKIMGRNEYSAFWTVVFSLLTFGIYFFYHEYKLTNEIHRISYGRENKDLSILCGVASAFGMWFIVDTFQQHMLNSYIKYGPVKPNNDDPNKTIYA